MYGISYSIPEHSSAPDLPRLLFLLPVFPGFSPSPHDHRPCPQPTPEASPPKPRSSDPPHLPAVGDAAPTPATLHPTQRRTFLATSISSRHAWRCTTLPSPLPPPDSPPTPAPHSSPGAAPPSRATRRDVAPLLPARPPPHHPTDGICWYFFLSLVLLV